MAEAICDNCGNAVRDAVTSGLCPRCLLLRAVETAHDVDDLSPEDLQGRQVGPYLLLEEIARGGIGIVFRARDSRLGRIVALKLLQGGTWVTADVLERFRIEAKATASFTHPNIVPVYGFGEEGEDCYIAMRLIEGSSLAEWRQLTPGEEGNPAPPSLLASQQPSDRDQRVAEIMRKISEAVHYAHQRGVLHRDLKPGNVLLDPSGEPFLTDFGLARRLDDDIRLTRSNTSLGTPAYLSPEVARTGSSAATVQSDVYGLGAIMYELLSGSPPFLGSSPLEVMRLAVEAEPKPPSSRRPGVDRDLETICLKCLSKEPALRYASCQALADDLGRWLRDEPIEARPSSPIEKAVSYARRKPLISGLLALLFLLLCLVAFAVGKVNRVQRLAGEEKRQSLVRFNVDTANRHIVDHDKAGSLPYQLDSIKLEAGHPDREAIHRIRLGMTLRSIPRLERLWQHDLAVNGVEFSKDGLTVLSSSDDNTACIWDIATGKSLKRFQHQSPVLTALFSPDAQSVLTLCRDGLAHCWDLQKGVERFPAWPFHISDYRMVLTPDGSFSPDGRLILTSQGRRVEIRRSDSGALAFPDFVLDQPVQLASFSADGTQMLTVEDGGRVGVWQLTPSGPRLRASYRHTYTANVASFSPDGQRVVSVAPDADVVVWDASTGHPLGEPIRHPSNLRINQATFSPLGDRVLSLSFDGSIRIREASGDSTLTRGIGNPTGLLVVRWDGNGERVITGGFDGVARVWDVKTGTIRESWLRHSRYVVDAAFSPITNQIVTACLDGTIRLWSLTQASEPEPLPEARSPARLTSLSQAGLRMARSENERMISIHDTQAMGRPAQLFLHTNRVVHIKLDAEGKRLATITSDHRLHLWDTETCKELVPPVHLRRAARTLEYVQDGSRLGVMFDGARARTNILFSVYDGKTLSKLCDLQYPEEPVHRMDFSPDGHWVASSSIVGKVHLWNTQTGEETLPFLAAAPTVIYTQISPNGRWILTLSADGGFGAQAGIVWSMKTRVPVGVPLRHNDGVTAGAFSADSTKVVTGGEDGIARVWSVPEGNPLTPPLPHDSTLRFLAFGMHDQLLATATRAGVVRLWDAVSGDPLIAPQPIPEGIASMDFVQARQEFLVVGRDGTLHRWDLSEAKEPIDELARISQRLNGGP